MINTRHISFLALILLVVGAIGSFITFKPASKPFSVSEERILTDKTITDIEIRANDENVNIFSTKDSKTKVQLTGTSVEKMDHYFSVEVEDGTLLIKLKDDKPFFDFFHFRGTSLTLDVYLSEKVYESLHVDMNNGEIQAEKLRINNIEAKLANGYLEMKDIVATMLKADSDNGEIHLENIEGEIYGNVNNGQIYLKTNHLDRSLTFESDNGDIEIKTDQKPTNAVLDIKTKNGEVTVFGNSNWDTVIGNGENQIKLTTNNGDIRIVK